MSHETAALAYLTGYTARMLREQSFHTSRRGAFRGHILRTRSEALAELRRPCGRFKSIIPTEETLRSYIAEKVADIDDVGNSLFIDDGTPLNWQRMLSFLHENKILAAPRFDARYHRNDYPNIMHFFELAPMKSPDLSDGYEVMYNGFGGSPHHEVAMSKAVGEVLERYFLSTYKRDRLHAASYTELSKRSTVIDIRQFDFFLDWQKKRFPAFAFDNESVFQWVEGRALQGGASVYLPAQLVYWNYLHTPQGLPPEQVISMQTTSGSAGHFTKDEATLAALLEAIQRDAFLIYWLNTLTPRVIDIETITDPTIINVVEHLRRFNLEPIFLNTTSDFKIPTATCVIIDRADAARPIFSIGSGAGFTVEETLLSSAIEALAVLHFVSQQEPYPIAQSYEPFTSAAITRFERLRAWQGPTMAERIPFFLSGKKQSVHEFIGDAPSMDTVEKRLAHITNECAAHGEGYEIYIYEVKNLVLEQLGYHVVRAIVPELVPLYLVEFAAPLKARRLKEVPGKIGYRAAKELNPWPHPFP